MSVFDQQFQATPSCFGFGGNSPRQPQDFPQPVSLDDAEEQKKNDIDAALSEAMNNLTFEERQEQIQVLHGVDDMIAEEPTLINRSLLELDGWLQKTKAGTMYEQAERADPNYVSSSSFRIMFLRGNRYDAKAAADQMLRFFQVKQEVFGMEKLVKDITISDLDQDDRECIKTGFMQDVGRDSSGRAVLFGPQGLRNFKHLQNELRARYYVIMKMLESEETQLRGAVTVAYMVGEFRDKGDKGGVLATMRFMSALPLYAAAIHMCSDSVAGYLLFSGLIKAMPEEIRARLQIHCGSHLEVQYKLSTYGISAIILPFTPTYGIRLHNHLRWYESCLAAEEGNKNVPLLMQEVGAAIHPTSNDVLYVDGKTSNNAGNNFLRSLVKENEEAYQTGNTKAKRKVVDNIVAEIQCSGGRFLKHVKDMEAPWVESPLAEAQNKIKQMFRNQKRKLKQPQGEPKLGVRIVDQPLPADVVFGKANKIPGNVFLRQLVWDRTEEYESLDRGKKAAVVDTILQQIKGEGGRLLLPDSDGWIELSDEAARGRIARCFRNNRRYVSHNKFKTQ